MRNESLLFSIATLLLSLFSDGFSVQNSFISLVSRRGYSGNAPTKCSVLFAEEPPQQMPGTKASTPPPPIELVASDNENFLNMVGGFLVDSFWLNSEHHKIGDTSKMTPDAKMSLIVEQCADLQEKFGEKMGKRLFDSCVFGALDTESKKLLGVGTIQASLLMGGEILETEKAEVIAKNAVASLGPKQRRLYKDASISTIATELLSPGTKAVCVLSNLAISTEARRRGVASMLCEEAEAFASDWGYDQIHLLVEKENLPARGLYEGRLGYSIVSEEEGTLALRADPESGSFEEVQVDTLILAKPVLMVN
jgi:ribosomal protein S18 acetylase RimI-like enzyme